MYQVNLSLQEKMCAWLWVCTQDIVPMPCAQLVSRHSTVTAEYETSNLPFLPGVVALLP